MCKQMFDLDKGDEALPRLPEKVVYSAWMCPSEPHWVIPGCPGTGTGSRAESTLWKAQD